MTSTSGVASKDEVLGMFRVGVLGGFDRVEQAEARLLEHALGADVGRGGVCDKGSIVEELDERLESGRRDPSPPDLTSEPVADESSLGLAPRDEVTRHCAVRDDRPDRDAPLSAQTRPVAEEGVRITTREVGDRVRDRIVLLLEEDR